MGQSPWRKRSEFDSDEEYRYYMKTYVKVGMKVRYRGDNDDDEEENRQMKGREGKVHNLDRDDIDGLNVQVCFFEDAGVLWVDYADLDILD